MAALAGGVGAAKFLSGLVRVVDPSEVTVIGNTGDDAVFHGLHVSPDLDIVTYTLAGIVHERGWGLADDSTYALEQLQKLGVDTWFMLGDSDLGTHMARTAWLREGLTLTEVTDRIRRALGVSARIIPMTDHRVRTKVLTAEGVLREFQEYFVRYNHSEKVSKVTFEGAGGAIPAPGVLDAVASADRIVVCPSNPVVSIGPILSLPGIRQALAARRNDVFAVSPIVAGAALRGPADRLLPVVGAESSALGVAGLYTDFCGNFLLDVRDSDLEARIKALRMKTIVTDTIMTGPEVAEALAKEIISA